MKELATLGSASKIIILLASVILNAGITLADTKHAISLGWTSSEDTVSGTLNNGDPITIDIAPSGIDLSYSYALNDKTTSSLSYDVREDDKDLQGSFKLNRNSITYTIALDYLLNEDLSLSSSLRHHEEETRVRSPSNPDRHQEDYTVSEFELALIRDFFLDTLVEDSWLANWLISPSLSLTYQKSQFDLAESFTSTQNPTGRFIPIRASENEDSEGVYAGIGINGAYLIDMSDRFSLIVSLTTSWSEPLSGTVYSTTSAQAGNQTLSPTQDNESINDSSGSGSAGLNILALSKEFSFGLGFARSYSTSNNLSVWNASIGYDF